MLQLGTREKKESLRLLQAVGGMFLLAWGTNWFIVPMGFYSGGLLGAAQLLRSFLERYLHIGFGNFDISGILYMVINLPLFFLAYTAIGRGFFLKSLVCTVSLTFFLSVIPSAATPIIADPLAACLIGGIISGAGTGIALRNGASGGGTDILGMYFAKKIPYVSVGKVAIAVNIVVYALAALMFDLSVAIYSVIFMTIMNLVLDRVHLQIINVEVCIFTKGNPAVLKERIIEEMTRGVTTWEIKGGYTDEPGFALYTIINKYEASTLRSIVREIDPNAFVTMNEGVEVMGNFLKKL